MTSNFIPPQIRGTTNTNSSRYTHKLGSPSVERNILIPGTLTLDTDSEADASKLQIREKLMNVSTTRNIRNKTIDVPSMIGSESFRTGKKPKIHTRSNLGQVGSARRAGVKKGSVPHASNQVLNSPGKGKPGKLFVDDSEAQIFDKNNGNLSLPMI